MRKITNTAEASEYYGIINKFIDEYIDTWKVKPSEISQYFKRNKSSFLEKSGLSDVEGIEKVFNDVLDHRKNMQKDKVMTFESYVKLNEGVIDIEDANIDHEKVLSDFYKTSIGHVELINDKIHLYKINDFGKKVYSVIFSDSELSKIYKNIEDKILEESKNRVLSISEIDGVEVDTIKLWLSDIISEEKFRESFKKKVGKDQILLIIKNIIKSHENIPTNFNSDKLSYKDGFKGYHIWEVR